MPDSPPTKSAPRRASALFTVLAALAVFALFTAAVATLAIQRLRGNKRSVLQTRANYACEAGFILATEWLEQQIVYNDGANSLSFNPINPTNFNNTHTNITLAVDQGTKLSVRITSNMLPPAVGAPTAILGPNGVTIQPGQVYVQTVATASGDLAPASSRHLGGFASLGTQNYPYAIQCEGPVTLTNSNVTTYTSYDMSNPGQPLACFWEYHWVDVVWKGFPPLPKPVLKHNAKNPPPGGGICLHNGGMPGDFINEARILSNARVKAITLNNSKVDGQLFCGAGATPATAITVSPAQTWVAAPPTASGFPLFITKYKPPVEPATVAAVHNGGSLTVSPGTYYKTCTINGGKLTLNCNQPGANEFYFSDSLTLNGTTVEVANANVNTRAKVYVGRQLTMNNCKVNMGPGSWSPKVGPVYRWSFNLSFLGVGSGGLATNPTGQTQVNIVNSDVWALFAGSAMNFNMTGGELGGAIKCNSANITNGNMFYDVGLNVNAVASTLWGRVSWTMTGVTDYGDALYQLVQAGVGAAGAMAPQGPGAMGVGQVGAGAAANLGANGGAAIAVPNAVTVGTGAAASSSAFSVVSASASFWASLFLGQ